MKDIPDWTDDVHILIEDDDDSPFDGVVALLRRCIGFGKDNAEAWARHLSRNQRARLGPWSVNIANAIVSEMVQLAPRYGCRTLRATLEDPQRSPQAELPAKHGRAAHHVLGEHFQAYDINTLVIVRREFPTYLRVDVMRALETLTPEVRCVGIHRRHQYESCNLAAMLSERSQPLSVGALQFEDVELGDGELVRLATNRLSLFGDGDVPYALWVNVASEFGDDAKLNVEILVPPGESGAACADRVVAVVEAAVAHGRSYRGKILSLEQGERFRGAASGVLTVHPRFEVDEDHLILPDAVKGALLRHVVEFAGHRQALKALGQSGRKGILLYGPPGTGKTHSIRYLAQRLVDHTTFLVTADQIALIGLYFRLARLFAPSMVVIEDADLIARQRDEMQSPCEEVMLNRLLNEMDGLKSDADIFVVMTTNRPQALEEALIQRPGRIDHAIEVPLPDADCRARLLRLYAGSLELDPNAVDSLVQRTEGVSAAFVKEMARRLAQQSVYAGRPGRVQDDDVQSVLKEMMSERDGINLRLLGATLPPTSTPG